MLWTIFKPNFQSQHAKTFHMSIIMPSFGAFWFSPTVCAFKVVIFEKFQKFPNIVLIILIWKVFTRSIQKFKFQRDWICLAWLWRVWVFFSKVIVWLNFSKFFKIFTIRKLFVFLDTKFNQFSPVGQTLTYLPPCFLWNTCLPHLSAVIRLNLISDWEEKRKSED